MAFCQSQYSVKRTDTFMLSLSKSMGRSGYVSSRYSAIVQLSSTQRPSSTMTGTRSERPPVLSRMPVNPPGTVSISNPLCLSAYLVDQTNGLMVQPDASCRSNSAMVLFAATGSNLELLERRRMKQLLRREPPHAQALRVMMAEERIEHVPVRLEAIAPVVVPHECTDDAQVLLGKRQGHLRGGRVRKRSDRLRF